MSCSGPSSVKPELSVHNEGSKQCIVPGYAKSKLRDLVSPNLNCLTFPSLICVPGASYNGLWPETLCFFNHLCDRKTCSQRLPSLCTPSPLGQSEFGILENWDLGSQTVTILMLVSL